MNCPSASRPTALRTVVSRACRRTALACMSAHRLLHAAVGPRERGGRVVAARQQQPVPQVPDGVGRLRDDARRGRRRRRPPCTVAGATASLSSMGMSVTAVRVLSVLAGRPLRWAPLAASTSPVVRSASTQDSARDGGQRRGAGSGVHDDAAGRRAAGRPRRSAAPPGRGRPSRRRAGPAPRRPARPRAGRRRPCGAGSGARREGNPARAVLLPARPVRGPVPACSRPRPRGGVATARLR